MKKIISILLLSGLLLTCFAGCAIIDSNGENEMNIMDKIKTAYVRQYLLDYYPAATINDVTIEKNMGTYSEAQVLFITSDYIEYAAVETKETIYNYTFEYANSNSALVFWEDSFYTLKEAYKRGILSEDDLSELINQFPIPSGAGMEINGEPIV